MAHARVQTHLNKETDKPKLNLAYAEEDKLIQAIKTNPAARPQRNHRDRHVALRRVAANKASQLVLITGAPLIIRDIEAIRSGGAAGTNQLGCFFQSLVFRRIGSIPLSHPSLLNAPSST